MTYVRMTTLQPDPSKVEELLRFNREHAAAAIRQQPGYEGQRLLVDRSSGTLISVTLWASEAAARAGDTTLSQPRTQAVQLSGAPTPTTDIFEMVSSENA
jgi:heme-degrading monooxygenase HmoA